MLTKEELNKSKDYKKHFKIVSDNRDLNYDKYFSNGSKDKINLKDYTSENTKRLNVNQTSKIINDILKEKFYKLMEITVTGANGFLAKNLIYSFVEKKL